MITSPLSKKKLLRNASRKPIEGDATANETDPEPMNEEFVPTQSHGQPVPGTLTDECEYAQTVMSFLARMEGHIRRYQDRICSVNQR